MVLFTEILGSVIKSFITAQTQLRGESTEFIKNHIITKESKKVFETINIKIGEQTKSIPILAITGIPHMEIADVEIEFMVKPTIRVSNDGTLESNTNEPLDVQKEIIDIDAEFLPSIEQTQQNYIKFKIKLQKSLMEKGLETILNDAKNQIKVNQIE